MNYEWLSTSYLGFNHLSDVDGKWLCCSGNIFFGQEGKAKYDSDKNHCTLCIKYSENSDIKITGVIIPKTTCPNVLHINRKIFI